MSQGKKNQILKAFNELDSDNDGEVSMSELTTHLVKDGWSIDECYQAKFRILKTSNFLGLRLSTAQ